MQKKEYSASIGGKEMKATFTDLADQADGSVMLTMGNTTVLATAVMSKKKREDVDFFPLVVDYEEKFYAAGAILGSRFVRREGKPSDEATLSARVIDRTIRPLFDHSIRHEVQIVITILAIDEDDPDILAINAASLALATSDIPWSGPVSAVRIGYNNEQSAFSINPTFSERDTSGHDFDAIICGKDERVNMIEAGAQEASEETMEKALGRASEEIEALQAFQKRIIEDIGKQKRAVETDELPEEARQFFKEHVAPKLPDAVFAPGKNPHTDLKDEWVALFKERFPEVRPALAAEYFENAVDEILHREAIENARRADGRGVDELRFLYAQAGGLSPVLHGAGIFYRGGTHVLSVLTLGGPQDAQLIEGMEVKETKRFMHHYNFPPFSGGETGRIGGVNRRMIGHGALAERALAAVIPTQETFPYTIRLVSESLASNGSTSMASVCAGTLALMDGGVPITRPVAGIAMGLMIEQPITADSRYAILTDIQGPEDHHGDMDFKVAGTKDGITAVQMDVKVEGVPIAVLVEAFKRARSARLAILDTIQETIPEPRANLADSAPHILRVMVSPDKIGTVIGPGGKTINRLTEETGSKIDIEEDGTVYITGSSEGAQKAKEEIEALTHEYKAGEAFEGEVTKILDFGAFVKIGPQTEGLVHISELAPAHVPSVESVLSVGDRVPVVVKEIDDKNRINLSIKKRDPDFFKEKLASLGNQNTA